MNELAWQHGIHRRLQSRFLLENATWFTQTELVPVCPRRPSKQTDSATSGICVVGIWPWFGLRPGTFREVKRIQFAGADRTYSSCCCLSCSAGACNPSRWAWSPYRSLAFHRYTAADGNDGDGIGKTRNRLNTSMSVCPWLKLRFLIGTDFQACGGRFQNYSYSIRIHTAK